MPQASVRIDLSDIKKLAEKLGNIGEKIEANISPILNTVGDKLRDKLVQGIASELGVDESEVGNAVISRVATSLNPSFSVASENERFRYTRWVTARDEKVCPLCGPLDDKLILKAEAVLMFPVHPNCRCELHPVDVGGKLLEHSDDVLEQFMVDALEDLMKAGGFLE